MKHFTIRKAGILAFKCGFVAFGLLAIWLLGGIAEALGPWWLYLLASAGSFAAGGLAGKVLGPFSPEDVYSGCKVRQHLVFYFLLPQTAATVGIFIQPGRFPDSLGPQLMFYLLHPLLAALL